MSFVNLLFLNKESKNTILSALSDTQKEVKFNLTIFGKIDSLLAELTVGNNDTMQFLKRTLENTQGWEVVGPRCPKCRCYTLASPYETFWRCATSGCHYTQAVTSTALWTRKDIWNADKTYQAGSPMIGDLCDEEVEEFLSSKKVQLGMSMLYGETKNPMAGRDQSIKDKQNEIMGGLRPPSWREITTAELLKETNRLLRVVAGINYQDHTVREQREIRDAVHAVMAVLAKIDPSKKAD